MLINPYPELIRGHFVDLEVLSDEHSIHLQQLFEHSDFWVNPLYPSEKDFPSWFDKAIANSNHGEQQFTFVVRRKSDRKLVGTTRFYKIIPKDKRLAIGYTWYAEEARGTFINPECKLLMLAHAFEAMEMERVEFNINAANTRSRQAVKNLGAVEEGILRCYTIRSNHPSRDTAVYSIIKPEWPTVKETLKLRLQSD